MKRRKEPKKFNYPRMYFRPVDTNQWLIASLVIVYPDGRPAEACTIGTIMENIKIGEWRTACWNSFGELTPKQQVKRLKQYAYTYDESSFYIGEIK